MGVIIGSARIDERGKASGGAVGDQKQTNTPDYRGEVSLENFYVHSLGWYVLRAKNGDVAEKIAAAMYQACNNPNIGYDQNNRLGIISNGTATKTKTECDCSSLVRRCVYEATGIDAGNFTTSNEATSLVKTGLFDKLPYKSGMELYTGDILVTKSKGHTVIVTNGTSRTAPAPSTSGYYPAYTGSSTSIVTALKLLGIDSSYENRAKIAAANGISGYSGAAVQNTNMLTLLKQGKLIVAGGSAPSTSGNYYPRYTGATNTSLISGLAGVGERDTSFNHRKKIAAANGISNYTGTAAQNLKLLALLKQGKLIKG